MNKLENKLYIKENTSDITNVELKKLENKIAIRYSEGVPKNNLCVTEDKNPAVCSKYNNFDSTNNVYLNNETDSEEHDNEDSETDSEDINELEDEQTIANYNDMKVDLVKASSGRRASKTYMATNVEYIELQKKSKLMLVRIYPPSTICKKDVEFKTSKGLTKKISGALDIITRSHCSYNYNPIPYLLAGAQMVSINWQYRDEYWYIYNTIFNSGAYRKKPNLEEEENGKYLFKLKFNNIDTALQNSKLRYYKCVTKNNDNYDIKNYIDYKITDFITINGLNLHVFAIFIKDTIIPFECEANILVNKFNNYVSATAYKYYENDEKKFLPDCDIKNIKDIFEIKYETIISYSMDSIINV